MTALRSTDSLAALQSLVAQGESSTLELKRSTAELRRAGETLCAFLNGEGGKVLIGVGPDGRLVGQKVADITLRDIAAMLGRFPAAPRSGDLGAASCSQMKPPMNRVGLPPVVPL